MNIVMGSLLVLVAAAFFVLSHLLSPVGEQLVSHRDPAVKFSDSRRLACSALCMAVFSECMGMFFYRFTPDSTTPGLNLSWLLLVVCIISAVIALGIAIIVLVNVQVQRKRLNT